MKKYVLMILLLPALALFSGIGFLLFTNPGLMTILNLAGRFVPYELQIDSTEGSLAGNFALQGVRFTDDTNSIAVDKLSVSWRPDGLINKKFVIRDMEISGIDIHRTNIPSKEEERSRQFAAPLVAPLDVLFENVTVKNITIYTAGQEDPEKIDTIVLKNTGWQDKIVRIGLMEISAHAYKVSAEGHLQLDKDIAAELALAYSFSPVGYSPFQGTGKLSGSLSEITVATQFQKPIVGTLHGKVMQPFDEPVWNAVLDTDNASLAAINPGWPQFAFSAFNAEGEGTLATYSIQVDTNVDYADLKDVHLATLLAGDMEGLHFTGTSVRYQDGQLEGRGWLDWERTFKWGATVTGNEVDLSAIRNDWPDVVFSSIDIDGQGEGQQYEFEIQADGKYGDFDRSAHAASKITGNAEGMTISDARFSHGSTKLAGDARLEWRDLFAWNARIEGRQLDPAMWKPEFEGNIDVQLQTEGKIDRGVAAGHLDIISLEGVLRGYPLSAKGKTDFIDKDFRLHDISLQTVGTNITASGYFADTIDLQFEGSSSDLSVIWPELEGSFEADGFISGQRKHPAIVLNISGEGIKGFGNSIGQMNGEVNANLAPDGEINAVIAASQLSFAGRKIDSFNADIQGSTTEHIVNIHVSGVENNLELLFKGGMTDKRLAGEIQQAELHSATYGSWYLIQPGRLELSDTGLDAGLFCFTGIESSRLCLTGKFNKTDGWQIESEIESFPLAWLQQAAGLELDITLQGDISGSGRMAGRKDVLHSASILLTANNALVHLQLTEGDDYKLDWQKNLLKLDYSDNVLKTQVESILKDGSRFSASMNSDTPIPFSTAFAEIPVSGKIDIDIRNLDSLAALTFPLVEPSGTMVGDVTLNGTIGNPVFDGDIQLKNGKMGVQKAGILIDNLEMKLAGAMNEIDLKLSGNSGGGDLTADGTLTIDPEREIILKLAVRGSKFEAVHLPELRLVVSPELDLLLTGQELNLNGLVRVDNGIIAPYSIAGAVAPSRDVVFVRKKNNSRKEALPFSADLQILVNNKVKVNAFGLKGKLEGDIRVVDKPDKLATATGKLDVVDGTFSVYGRELQIKTGQLLFSGGPVYDPGVSVRAENTTRDVTTGVAVSGFLREPEINFYSDPPMEENEIISRLLLNTNLVGSADNDSGLITSATADSKLAPIGTVIKETKEAFRVDDVRVEAGKNSEDLSLVIGTWITPSLYLSYGKNLLKESGSFNTRYVLGHGFSLETETGSTASGVDFKYQIEK